MFIQQPVQVMAEPLYNQGESVIVDSLVRMHFDARVKSFLSEATDVVIVHRIEYPESMLVGNQTQVTLVVSAETASLDLFDQFMRSVFKTGETDQIRIVSVSYNGF